MKHAMVALFALVAALAGCDDPCEKLQKKVCEDPDFVKKEKRLCELMNEAPRRDALPRETCESILKTLSKR
jgi:hypothetical protein